MHRTPHWTAPLLALLLASAQAGCPDSPTPRDFGIKLDVTDAPVPDLADLGDLTAETAGDQALDTNAADLQDLAAEGSPADTSPEGGAGDTVGWDAGLSKASALYTVTKTKDSFGLHKISTDGKGKPTQVFGWHGLVDFDQLTLTNLTEYIPINTHVPRVTQAQHSAFQGVRLPNNLGTVYYYHRKLNAVSGLLQIRPSGSMKVILEVSGVYSDTLSKYIVFTDDGTRGAVIQGKNGVLLFRTDGKTFSGGKDWIDVTPASGFQLYEPMSLTMAGDWLYLTAKDTLLSDRLLRAPLDGSAQLKAVTLPASAGKVPVSISYQIAKNSKGTHLALSAGSLTTVHDVYTVDVKAGKATRVTSSPAYVSLCGNYFGHMGASLAVSPGGKTVAYVRWQNGNPELFVSRTAAGSKEIQVTDDKRFAKLITNVYNLVFASDDSVLFTAGENYYANDIYIWDHNLKQATNLTAIGSSPIPFNGKGIYYFQGGWFSPNGKWMYLLGYEKSSKHNNIYGVNLSTFKVMHITSKLIMANSADGFASCEGTGNLYFAAEADPLIHQMEVWYMDQNTGQIATKLTSMTKGYTGPWYVSNMALDKTCSRLAWAAGGSYWYNDIWTRKVSGASVYTAQKLTPNAMFIAPSVYFTPDSKTIVFGSGGSQNTTPLKAIAVWGGPLVTLDPTAGYLNIFAVQ